MTIAAEQSYHQRSDRLKAHDYVWPDVPLNGEWTEHHGSRERHLNETAETLALDSRWPAFFPSPISLVTTCGGGTTALEKVVGASIVNRFPYVIALSFCRQELSPRHHVRDQFMRLLEQTGIAAIQFLAPGDDLNRVMSVIQDMPDKTTGSRLERTGLSTRRAQTNAAPVFSSAYLVYEARLVSPGHDFEGQPIFERPFVDVGSHRVYFLEITAIQLRQDIASGDMQIQWCSLPEWQPLTDSLISQAALDRLSRDGKYAKGYTPHYRFPSAGTIAFEADEHCGNMAIKHLPPLPSDQVEVDNDRARWPCFFPSSVGMITSWDSDGVPNLMPCGSTTIVSRHPLVITPCVSYAAINERYAPRKSLESIRRTGRFGCGVPYVSDDVVAAIRYAGNVSLVRDPYKLRNAGLDVEADPWAPVLRAMPVHFDCEVTSEVRLGTHIMFMGEVKRIRLRRDVTADNPLHWCPWADVVPVSG